MSTAEAHYTANGHANGRAAPDLFGLPLPHDLQAEKLLIASMLFAPEVIDPVDNMVTSRDFHSEANGTIYRAIIAVNIQATPDAMLLSDELKRIGALEDVGGIAYLLELTEAIPHAGNAVAYAEIVRKHSLRRQALRSARDFMLRASDEQQDPAALVAEAARVFDEIRNTTASESRFKVLDAATLDETDHSVSYLVEDVLVEGQPCLLGGPQKALKTSLALALFLSLATGGTFLGRFRVNRRCRTLLLSGESGLGTIQETARRIAAADGYNLSDIEGFHVCSSIPQLASDEDLAELRTIIKRHRIEVLGIDPIYLAMPSADVSNIFAQGELLRRVGDMCQSLGVTLVLLHHTVKPAGKTYEPIELPDLSHSGFAEFARQWILIGRREKYEPGTGDHRLWLTLGGSVGHNSLLAVDVSEGRRSDPGGRCWEVSVNTPDEVRKDDREQQAAARAEKRKEQAAADLEHAKKEVIHYLVKRKSPDTYRGIRTGTGFGDAKLRPTIAALLDDKAIVEVEVKKHTRTEDGFALPKSEETHESVV